MGAAVLLFFLIYPHTRFAHSDNFTTIGAPGLNREKVTMPVGSSFYLYIKGVNKRASYSSSDFKVAAVSCVGKVRCLKPGVAIITVKQKNEKFTCKVHVTTKKDS